MPYKIKTFNAIAKVGLDQFSEHYEVHPELDNADAFLLRSASLHDFEFPKNLKAIARAGAGVNNIPIAKMTELGIPVFNTPGANANAVKELVLAGMLLASRNICQGWDYARKLEDTPTLAKTVEAGKKQFAGFELAGRTLGIIGLGAIGVLVANAAIALDMNVLGFDPAITVKHAWKLSSQVDQANSIEEVIREADFLTLHVPLNDKTKNMLNGQRLSLLKPTATLLNFSRNGLVELAPLLNMLTQKALHAYVTDFPTSAVLSQPGVISLPHLGASTREAEDNCAVMAARQISRFLEHGVIRNAVNFPEVQMPDVKAERIAITNKNVPNMVAQISSVLADAHLNIIDLINKSRDDIAYTLIDLEQRPSPEQVAKIQAIEGVLNVRVL